MCTNFGGSKSTQMGDWRQKGKKGRGGKLIAKKMEGEKARKKSIGKKENGKYNSINAVNSQTATID